jgi:hypothetical protein
VQIKIYQTIILPVALYEYKTWFVRLCEEHRLRVYENRVLRRISGPKNTEIIGGWRQWHNDQFHNLYSSSNKIRIITSKRMKWEEHVALMREKRKAHRVLVTRKTYMLMEE